MNYQMPAQNSRVYWDFCLMGLMANRVFTFKTLPMFANELTQLYQRLENYQLDDPTHEFGFTRHLIKNHGWTEKYAIRAIAEYKKFTFLTVVAEHQIVPSDAVDQVWHAHLLLTQSYWEEFCPLILGKKLHHHPARGGKTERAEFHYFYIQTIASYQQYFGTPPQDIWSPPDVRFGKELRMQRLSTIDNWIIPKYLPHKYLSNYILITGVLALILVLITIDRASATSVEDIDNGLLRSGSYLCLFLPIITGLVLRYYIRRPSKQESKPQLNLYQTAYLAGGSARAVESTIVKLVHKGYLRPNVRNRTFAIAKTLEKEANHLEHQVMYRVRRTPEFKKLKEADEYKVNDLRTQLEQNKLLIEQNLPIVMGYALILFFGVLLGGLFSEFLSENQILSFWCGSAIAVACLIIPGGRTRWGDFILSDIRHCYNPFDIVQRFALYGESVLSGGALDDLKQIYKAQQEADTGGCGCGC